MCEHRKNCRNDILIIGVGNTLREDDGIGILLARKLKDEFSGELPCIESYEADVLLAEEMSGYREVLIIDAVRAEDNTPFRLIPVKPSKSMTPASGFVSHVFDWNVILAMAEKWFGKAPKTSVFGVSAYRFGISEDITCECMRNAESAFNFLVDYCAA